MAKSYVVRDGSGNILAVYSSKSKATAFKNNSGYSRARIEVYETPDSGKEPTMRASRKPRADVKRRPEVYEDPADSPMIGYDGWKYHDFTYLLNDGCIGRFVEGKDCRTVFCHVYGPNGYYYQTSLVPYYDDDTLGDICDFMGIARPVEFIWDDYGYALTQGVSYEVVMELIERGRTKRGFRPYDYLHTGWDS